MKITIKGDITKLQVDAIVNAANVNFERGKGVDGAIHRAAGPELLEECHKQTGCNVGECVITKSYNLPANCIIHTMGPVWIDGKSGEIELLKSCYRNSLRMAIDNNCKTIAFPNISTGVYGMPKIEAAHAALETVTDFLNNENSNIDVTFVCFDDINYKIYRELCPTFMLD